MKDQKKEKRTHVFAKGVIITLLFSIIAFLLIHTILTYRYDVFGQSFNSFAHSDDAKNLTQFGQGAQDSLEQFRQNLDELQEQYEQENTTPSTEIPEEELDAIEKEIKDIEKEITYALNPLPVKIVLPIGYQINKLSDAWVIHSELEEYTLTLKAQEPLDEHEAIEELLVGKSMGYVIFEKFGTFDQKQEMTIYVPEHAYILEAVLYNGSKEQFIETTKDLIQRISYQEEKREN